MKKTKFIGMLWMGVTCCSLLPLSSCDESYPGIVYDDPDEVTSDFTSSDSIPIMLTVRTPELSFMTRGTGAIDEGNSEWKKKNTTFYVYGFQAPNSKYSGNIDFKQEAIVGEQNEDSRYCLVDGSLDSDGRRSNGVLHGREVVFGTTGNSLKTDESVVWKHKNRPVYYNQKHQDYKYNFFMYHIDDAVVSNMQRTSDKVSFDVEIDGTQDLISAIAAPNPSGDYKQLDQQEDRYLVEDIDDGTYNYVYSTLLGHRGVHPNFKVQHEMVRFSFELIKGDKASEDVVIEDILAYAPSKGRFTVASQNLDEVGIVWENDERAYRLPEQIDNPDGEGYTYTTTQYPTEIHGNYTVEGLELRKGSLKVGADLLLPYQTEYKLVLNCRQKVSVKNENGETEEREHKSSRVYTLGGASSTITITPGWHYVVSVYVYGNYEITLMTSGLKWNFCKKEIIVDDEENL